jgi:hypothetical protein
MQQISSDMKDIPGYSFTTDIWSSRALDPFISFCLIYITDEFTLKNIPLENKPFPGSHTAETIIESLEKTVEDWELPRFTPIYALRDNGSNMRAAFNHSEHFLDIGCFAHTLQLAINDAVAEVEGMQTMLVKSRKIVSHYHHSCQATEKLHTEQGRLGREKRDLLMSVATRWNSDFIMVRRLVDEREAVAAELSASGKVDNLTNAEWKLAEGYATILSNFEQASRELCSETYPTMSMKIPALHGLIKGLKDFVSNSTNRGSGIILARKLKQAVENRFVNFNNVMPDAACTFLDPRYKNMYSMNQDQQETEESITTVLQKYAQVMSLAVGSALTNSDSGMSVSVLGQAQPEPAQAEAAQTSNSNVAPTVPAKAKKATATASLWDNHDHIMQLERGNSATRQTNNNLVNCINEELKMFLKEPPTDRNSCPLRWWREHKLYMPHLARIARALLSIPATSVNSERLNSTSGNIVTIRRGRLLTEHVAELTFLAENLD